MNGKGILACIVFLFVLTSFTTSVYKPAEIFYIERFAPLAMAEMQRSGVPASIKLAQAIIESNAGRSILASNSNNHFGIKCKSYWKGLTYFHKDDDRNDRGQLLESCFRAYTDIESSFKDHSDFLSGSANYKSLFLLDPLDYKGWAVGLRGCGYATDKTYASKLIETIEAYKLYRYDTFDSRIFDLPLVILNPNYSIDNKTSID